MTIPAPGVAVNDTVMIGLPDGGPVSLATVLRFRMAPLSTYTAEPQVLVQLHSGPTIWVNRGSVHPLPVDRP